MEKVKYSILTANYDWTRTQWNEMTERYESGAAIRQGRCIKFEGTEEEFDEFYDKLTDTNIKIIGVYEG